MSDRERERNESLEALGMTLRAATECGVRLGRLLESAAAMLPEHVDPPRPEPKRMTVDEIVLDISAHGLIHWDEYEERVPVWDDLNNALKAGYVASFYATETYDLTPAGRKRRDTLRARTEPEPLCPECGKPASEHRDGLFCCGHCGNEAGFRHTENSFGQDRVWVRCSHCPAQTMALDTETEGTAAWNRRA